MEKSLTAQNHPDGKTILAWIHSHVGGNRCDFLSSIDVHNHRILEKTFGSIQSIVVEILDSTERFKVYNLTEIGRERIDKCREKAINFHSRCARNDFYAEVKPAFSSEFSLKTFDFSILYGEQVIALDEGGYLNLESDKEINSEDYEEEGVITDEVISINEDLDEIGEVSSGEDSASSNEDIESGKEFSCLSCGRIFKTTFALLQHVDKNKKNDCKVVYLQSNHYDTLVMNSKSQKMKVEEKKIIDCKYCQKSFVNILAHLKKNKNCMEKYVENNEFDVLEKNCKTKSRMQKNKKHAKRQFERYHEDEEFRESKKKQDKQRKSKWYNEDEEFKEE